MSREIICQDALKWLAKQDDSTLDSVITGICDMDEVKSFKDDLENYLVFFDRVSDLIMKKVSDMGYCIFIQTDRKYQGQWIDKSTILNNIAKKNGLKLKWHKIILLRGVGSTDLHRPCYSHMLCYSKSGKPGAATPDVIEGGKRIYKNGTCINAAVSAVSFIKKCKGDKCVIVDPFVGQGTIPAVCNSMGLSAIGIDIDEGQCAIARSMQFQQS